MRGLMFAAAFALLLGGCATITRGTTQTVAVDTPGVAGAMCTVTTANGPQTVATPGSFILPKSSATLPVRCVKECYQDGGGVLGSTFEAMTAGNLIVGGVIGIGVDAMSGAMNKYPDFISVPMVPIPACGVPAQPNAPGRRKASQPVAAVRPLPPAAPVAAQMPPPQPEPQLSEADRVMGSRN